MLGFIIYLASIADGLRTVMFIAIIVSIIATVISGVAVADFDNCFEEDTIRVAKYWFKRFVAILFITSIVYIMTPKSKTLVAMYLIPKLADSEAAAEMAKIPSKAAQLLNSKLESYLDEALEIKKEIKKDG